MIPSPKPTDTSSSDDLDCAHDHPSHDPDACTPASDEVLERAAAIFRAAGDVERLRILQRLGWGEHCVSELAAESGASLPTVSQRLRTLRNQGLVSRRREGKHVFYGLADDHVADLIKSAIEHAAEE